MTSTKYVRGQKFEWSPQKRKLLKKLYCVDRFHITIVLNNLGCTRIQLYRAIKKFGFKRKRIPSNKSKGTSFVYKPKLSIEKAREIRRLIEKGVHRKELAYMFNVSGHTIGLVKNNKIWKEKEDV